MPNEKNAPRKDGQVEDLPQKQISTDDAEQVKGGMGIANTKPTQKIASL